MEDHTRHPDHATLFDLIEGTLEQSRAQRIEEHLEGCVACAALVRAALAGSPDHATPVEPIPADAARRMQVVLGDAWRDRIATIAAAEAVDDERATTTAISATTPLEPDVATPAEGDAPTPRTAPPTRRRWSRRLVPVLAFGVLATIAGTSIYIGENDRGGSTNDAAVQPEQQDGTIESGSGSGSGAGLPQERGADTAASPSGDSVLDADGDVDGRDIEAAPESAQTTPGAPEEPPIGFEDEVAGSPESLDELCIATFDEAALYLPDGRIPQRIIPGPLGLYLVCG